LIDGAAKSLAEDFFRRFEEAISPEAASAPEAEEASAPHPEKAEKTEGSLLSRVFKGRS
jgi:hypothetical protein